MKRYVLIAGVNGAGKSTLYQTLESLQSMPRINVDEIVREFGDWKNQNDVMKAGRIAVGMIKEYFEKGLSFNQETTLCGKSILENIKYAKQLGYEIELHYVGIDSAELAKDRIAYRVAHGGHGIPDRDVERRFVESRDQFKKILPLCDMAVLYDNTENFYRVAIYKSGHMEILCEKQPNWYTEMDLVNHLPDNQLEEVFGNLVGSVHDSGKTLEELREEKLREKYGDTGKM